MAHDVSSLKARAQILLQKAGITLGGQRPTDLVIHDERTYARVFAHGTLGFGEAYMDGWWDVGDLPAFFARVLSSHLDESVLTLDTLMAHLKARLINRQRGAHAWDVGRRHYDLGNDLFEAMLGKRMVYSCAYWAHADNLDDAQEAKLDLICRKLALRPGQRILDIGCGWGEALKFAAERYGVSGVGVTVSQEQAAYARELCRGLPVEIRLRDYRELDEPFDAILSVGMFEHVGGKNYRTWFEVARRCLRKDGLVLLHTIGSNGAPGRPDPWIDKYIFPNSLIPSMSQVAGALEGLFVVEDWHNFGADYDRTLMAWRANVDAAWPRLASRYDERFRRMWNFYLGCSAGVFRSRRDQLWQLTLSPHGRPGGYRVPR
ncbi:MULTISPECIES: cyclopropane fatty acyl phospholipid synthase [Rhodanobacteraceae]|uniref:cyclopropane fatty acyl phospholipid synthase n=1 Tax=Rhodanobacteraceae TaxID=1775411 RepID=UPI00088FBA3D|nr:MULTISPECIES: cyclopropane fatty acyl phospholipid synthase [Rhodanobacteraceae]SDG44176.1 cyclopropane-fatty-acyl-phospholipid synthase [Dyella sp. 333MFSha]SKB89875.1 cyclopropane-fatty-acyl-phospholipid synthase [Luteibacter sp. 22Crub2.1]